MTHEEAAHRTLINESLIPNASDFPYLNKGWISNKVDEIRFCVSQL